MEEWKTMDSQIISSKRNFKLLVLLIILSAIGPFSMQIFIPALPAIRSYFAEEIATVQLSLSLSMIAIAMASFISGPLSDKYGRKPVIISGLFVFLLGTLIAAISNSIIFLILGRIIQAAGGTIGITLSRAIVRDLWPEKEISRTLAQITLIMVLAPMIAPTLGASIISNFDWRWLFIYVFVGVLVILFFAIFLLPETNVSKSHNNSYIYTFINLPTLLYSRLYIAYTLQSSFALAGFFTFIAAVPYLMIESMGYKISDYGTFFLMISGLFCLGNLISIILSKILSGRSLIFLGSTIAMIGAILMMICLISFKITPLILFTTEAIIAFGNGLAVSSTSAGIVNSFPKISGSASGLSGSIQMLTGALFSQLVIINSIKTPYLMLCLILIAALISLLSASYILLSEKRLNINT